MRFVLSFVPLQSNLDYGAFFATWIWPVLAGVLGAVVGGYFVVISVNHWQKPILIISLAENRYDGQAPLHYVHLLVQNKNTFWRRWIGGGTATHISHAWETCDILRRCAGHVLGGRGLGNNAAAVYGFLCSRGIGHNGHNRRLPARGGSAR